MDVVTFTKKIFQVKLHLLRDAKLIVNLITQKQLLTGFLRKRLFINVTKFTGKPLC